MNKKKKSVLHFYGIQNRFFLYTMILLFLALFFSSIVIAIIVKQDVSEYTIDKYRYVNEKMGLTLENEYKNSDELLKECILQEEVQKSLLNRNMTPTEQLSLSQYFSYLNYKNIEDYVYLDNKDSIYTKTYRILDRKKVKEEEWEQFLGTDYSKTKWFFTEDTLFQTNKNALFIGRYVRSMNYQHKPGMLLFKIKDTIFSDILADISEEEVFLGISDNNGFICYMQEPYSISMSKGIRDNITLFIQENENKRKKQILKEGVLLLYRQTETNFTAFTFIPNRVLNKAVWYTLAVIFLIYFIIIFIAAIFSFYFAKRFTRPIRKINDAMMQFDGEDFTKLLDINTNTELDTIGQNYNKMLYNIKTLLDKIKIQERDLYKSRLNSLMYQINPHFLYNTLDTIYMLARINKEETTMNMIQSLSKFLKVSLSKGNDTILIEDELMHVKSYMEIQKIRDNNLFVYEIECLVQKNQVKILKLILQPLVENSIKHGFCEMYEGGIIRISITWEEEMLVLKIYNNGISIQEQEQNKINQLQTVEIQEIKKVFEEKQGGYGVTNVISRLRLRYGEKVKFYFERLEEGTNCVIQIPKEQLEEGR